MKWSEAFEMKELLLSTVKKDYSCGMALGLIAVDSDLNKKIDDLENAAEKNEITPNEYFSGFKSIVSIFLDKTSNLVGGLDEIINR